MSCEQEILSGGTEMLLLECRWNCLCVPLGLVLLAVLWGGADGGKKVEGELS